MAIKIYIDQGHNPENPNAGAEGNGYREQDLVYTIGQELATILSEAGYETRLSRPNLDTQLGSSNSTSLAARVNDANSWGADYFISLHANASDIPSASGSEALVYRTNSTAADLGAAILRGLTDATGLPNRGVAARPELYVLRRTRMPAVLTELGFITNAGDAALMANQPQLFARGVADGIIAFTGGAHMADTTVDIPVNAPVTDDSPVQFIYLKDPLFPGDPVLSDGTAMAAPSSVFLKDTETPSEAFSPEGPGTPSTPRGSVMQPTESDKTYAQFQSENPRTGQLKVQAFRGAQIYPVPDVKVMVRQTFLDGEQRFFDGKTDANGIIDNVILPAPPRSQSLTPNQPDPSAVYLLTATHPQYQTVKTDIQIYEGIKTIQPLRLALKEG